MRRYALVVLIATLAIPVLAAEPLYYGTWSFNPAKSDPGTTTLTYSKVGDEFQQTLEGTSCGSRSTP